MIDPKVFGDKTGKLLKNLIFNDNEKIFIKIF